MSDKSARIAIMIRLSEARGNVVDGVTTKNLPAISATSETRREEIKAAASLEEYEAAFLHQGWFVPKGTAVEPYVGWTGKSLVGDPSRANRASMLYTVDADAVVDLGKGTDEQRAAMFVAVERQADPLAS